MITTTHAWSFAATCLVASMVGCGLEETGTTPLPTNSGSSTSGGNSSGLGGEGGLSVGGGPSTGGNGGGSTSSSGSGSGGMAGSENCNDGTDNDGDGKLDCADNDCGKFFTCNAPPPSGWSYVRIRQTTFGGTPEACDGGQQPQVLYESPNGADCNMCTCSAMGKCQITMTCYSNDSCNGSQSTATYVTDTEGCVADGVASAGGGCRITSGPTVPSNAKCDVLGGGLVNADPFANELHVCPAMSNAAGCDADTCVLAPSGTYLPNLCISHSGSQQCPAGFSETHVGFGAYKDMRVCSACGCDKTMIRCMGPSTVTLATDAACTQDTQNVGTNCVDVPGSVVYREVAQLASQIVPNCPQSMPSGNVMTSGAVTVCCAPP